MEASIEEGVWQCGCSKFSHEPKTRGKIETSFKAAWRGLERVDKIETLISLERELAAQRKEISSELHKHSKGKW